MRIEHIRVLVMFLALALATGCATQQKQVLTEVTSDAPVDCRTAQGDMRVLKSEKAHVAEQMAEGVSAIFPAGAVLGILTGTETTKLKVAVGDYNEKIDARIAAIEQECGME